MNNLQLEKRANTFREINGLGSNDAIRLKSLLTKLNVIVVFKPLSDKFSGMALKVDENKFMLINSNHTLGKQHFTICHELYHLFIQENFTSMICDTGKFNSKDGEEYNADRFASILLLPELGIKDLIPENETSKDKISLKTILRLEQYFSCSRGALLYRLKELKLISNILYDKFKVNVKKSAVEYGHDLALYNHGNNNLIIGNYGEYAKELYDKEIISESHYLSLLYDLGMNQNYLNEIFGSNE